LTRSIVALQWYTFKHMHLDNVGSMHACMQANDNSDSCMSRQ
jgi:hypothetical protein